MTIKDTMMPVISSYHGATTFGQTSPGNASRPYQPAASPGPTGQDVYNQSPEQSYVQATSPQPSGFQALAINRVCSERFSYSILEGCLRMSGSDGARFLTESAPTAPTSQP